MCLAPVVDVSDVGVIVPGLYSTVQNILLLRELFNLRTNYSRSSKDDVVVVVVVASQRATYIQCIGAANLTSYSSSVLRK